MNPQDALTDIIRPALAALPANLRGDKAEVMLLAIGLQESRFIYRKQIAGPARGFWQFERNGVQGVLSHPASDAIALKLCSEHAAKSAEQVHVLLETQDILACQLARLLLWTDPRPLPQIGEVMSAWDYYVRNWRPGKPHKKTWADCYAKAVGTVKTFD